MPPEVRVERMARLDRGKSLLTYRPRHVTIYFVANQRVR